MPDNETMKITWTVRTRYSTVLTADEAREAFGLGGTSSEDLPDRISLLATSLPGLLMRLMDGQDFEQDEHFELRSITDPRDGHVLYPEP